MKALTGKHQYCEFSQETIKGRVDKMVALRNSIDASDYHIRLSYGNRKTSSLVPSVSLIPIADCGNCKLCSRGCYDIRNVCCYKQSQAQRAVNSAILTQDRDRYFDEVEAACKFLRFFRWHIGGDIKDEDYLRRMIRVAVRVPHCEFLCFTKMYDVVNFCLERMWSFPANLHIIFSDWRGAEFDNPHNIPVSSPRWADGTTGPHCGENAFMCPSNCAECAEAGTGCWGAKPGDTILFEAH